MPIWYRLGAFGGLVMAMDRGFARPVSVTRRQFQADTMLERRIDASRLNRHRLEPISGGLLASRIGDLGYLAENGVALFGAQSVGLDGELRSSGSTVCVNGISYGYLLQMLRRHRRPMGAGC